MTEFLRARAMKRRPLRLPTAVLLLLAVMAGCATETDSGPTAGTCGGTEAEPIACHLGVCHVLLDGCAGDRPASCPDPNPQGAEICDDGLDNNCDGQVDDGCTCTSDQSKPCYSGSPATRTLGRCHDGVQQCQNGVWGPCQNDVLPANDTCDGFDNDCDGQVDEGCPCQNGHTQRCYGGSLATLDVGACTAGTQTCQDGVWGDCAGDVGPQLEQCDGLDNDCDGIGDADPLCACVGEEITISCYGGPYELAGIGECKLGTQQECTGGTWGICEGFTLPTEEICNGLDDDCNGLVDDSDLGRNEPCVIVRDPPIFNQCAAGQTICVDGVLACQQIIWPNPELCNGLDDDCDGAIDNGNLCCGDDGVLSGGETDVDCGGPCAQKCAPGNNCLQGLDCVSQVCEDGICQPPP